MRAAMILLLVAGFALAACSSKSPPDDPVKWTADLPQSEKLAGRDLAETTDGPWTIRRVSVPGSTGRRELAAGEAPAPTGAPMPVEAAPGKEEYDLGGIAEGKARDKEWRGEAHGDDGPAPDASPMEPPAVGGGSGGAFGGRGGSRPTRRPARSSPLRAGSTDDNEKYEDFLEFLATWSDKPGVADQVRLLDVADRAFIRVVNEGGKPVPGAQVRVVSESADRIVLNGSTYGDGRVPFYPHVAAGDAPNEPASFNPEGDLIVEVRAGGQRKRLRWDGKGGELTVEVDVPRPVEEPIALDVLFLIDTTGSMSDEIEQVKDTLLSVTQKLRSLDREFDLRYGAVLYRDVTDDYVTKAHAFTSDIQAFDDALQGIQATGGGDTPESLNQGLAEAVGRMDWRAGAAKVMFLIADAPPHMDYADDVPYDESLKAAVAKGIRIHSVAASGLDELGSLVFRQIAQFTRGKFVFVEYGTVEKSAAAHGVAGKVKSNNLDDIIFEQIREEVARWGR